MVVVAMVAAAEAAAVVKVEAAAVVAADADIGPTTRGLAVLRSPARK